MDSGSSSAGGVVAYPAVGPSVPRVGGRLSRFFGRLILRLAGWRFEGEFPDVPKLVICVVPHTSNWDFVIGYAAKMSLNLRASWLGKDSLFWGPLGPLMRSMGGIPVDRSAPHGVVGQAADWFGSSAKLMLGIAPEGTRKKVERWKMGFYHIARRAGVPILPVALDWGTRRVRLGPPLTPSANESADLELLLEFYRRVRGRRPWLAYPPPAS